MTWDISHLHSFLSKRMANEEAVTGFHTPSSIRLRIRGLSARPWRNILCMYLHMSFPVRSGRRWRNRPDYVDLKLLILRTAIVLMIGTKHEIMSSILVHEQHQPIDQLPRGDDQQVSVMPILQTLLPTAFFRHTTFLFSVIVFSGEELRSTRKQHQNLTLLLFSPKLKGPALA